MRWLLPKSLNGFLLLGLCVLAGPLLFAILNATVQMRRLADTSQRLVGHSVQTTRLSQDVYAQIALLERSARLYEVLGDPTVLLCDEPLLALDLASQRAVTRLIDERRRAAGTPVIFVTHEVNPVLPYVDRILYLVRGRFAIGTPAEILTSERLSDLYGIEVDVVKVRDRYLVVSAEDELPTEPGAHPHHAHDHDHEHEH